MFYCSTANIPNLKEHLWRNISLLNRGYYLFLNLIGFIHLRSCPSLFRGNALARGETFGWNCGFLMWTIIVRSHNSLLFRFYQPNDFLIFIGVTRFILGIYLSFEILVNLLELRYLQLDSIGRLYI